MNKGNNVDLYGFYLECLVAIKKKIKDGINGNSVELVMLEHRVELVMLEHRLM
ncbi:hypothetical protein [Shewanella hafniensis]|uniref:hypothetical protein n=1 Tax=Shewanella hafniensis TaxID=365590 RepID=UPI001C7E7B2A|nr:hypothetical protein [Shewanella hafniensis]MCL1136690.1 hypothetical protein [Shewanella hafniensis]